MRQVGRLVTNGGMVMAKTRAGRLPGSNPGNNTSMLHADDGCSTIHRLSDFSHPAVRLLRPNCFRIPSEPRARKASIVEYTPWWHTLQGEHFPDGDREVFARNLRRCRHAKGMSAGGIGARCGYRPLLHQRTRAGRLRRHHRHGRQARGCAGRRTGCVAPAGVEDIAQ